MRASRERDFRREQREANNLEEAIETGRRDGLTFRPLQLTDQTRLRGGHKTRRRKVRVWKPIEPASD